MYNPDFHVSFEFFPPKDERGWRNLLRSAERLKEENPEFFSVTYGAGGSTKSRTFETVRTLLSRNCATLPHLSWGDEPSTGVIEQIQSYVELGVRGFVVIRGDLPSGTVGIAHHASDLVELIRARFGDDLKLFVAGYPEVHPDAKSASQDIGFLKEKVSKGADACFTQYFFNPDAYCFFVDECAKQGIDIPIVPGIMPITNYDQLIEFSRKCEAEVPRWIERRLYELKHDRESLEAFGHEVVLSLCQQLYERGAPGIHFYTLNRAVPTQRILKDLVFA